MYSFGYNYMMFPIMCMEKKTTAELGEAIGRVEEVEIDAAGECICKFL